MLMDHDALAAFLIEAKQRTYAGLDDDATVATPLLAGSKQLEHRAGPCAYRDIYFGMGFFVGQETVSKDDGVIWSATAAARVRKLGTATRCLRFTNFCARRCWLAMSAPRIAVRLPLPGTG